MIGATARTIGRNVGHDKSHVVVVVDTIQNASPQKSTTEIVGVYEKDRVSSVSECYVDLDLDLESDDHVKVHLSNNAVIRDCRICHLSMDMNNHDHHDDDDDDDDTFGTPIELGCSCKDDLASAHKQCAEAWFKVKGNKTCEICGSIASNVAGVVEVETAEQRNEANDVYMLPTIGPVPPAETRSSGKIHWFLTFLLVCTVFAFLTSWLFHFHVPSL